MMNSPPPIRDEPMNTIFPDYQVVRVKELRPGALFFLNNRRKNGDFVPYLFISQTVIQGSNECFIFSLMEQYRVTALDKFVEGLDAYVLKGDWRFRLKDKTPVGLEISPLNAPLGSIAICEDGKFIRGTEALQGFANSIAIDADQMCFREFTKGKSQNCFYSAWVIEARGAPEEPWELLYDPSAQNDQE